MKILSIVPVVFLCLLLPSAKAQDNSFVLLTPEQAITPGSALTETVWRATDPSGQAIGLHRYRRPAVEPIARLLYLPGTNMNGTLKKGAIRRNLWLYLAEQGIEVYTLDYRTFYIPHDTSGDLAFMRDWTMDLFVSDAERAALHIRQAADALPLFVAGFSRGAAYAYALAGRQSFAGLIALDGSFKSLPYRPFDLGGAMRQFDQEGRYASPLSRRGHTWRTRMLQDVINDPGGPASDAKYSSAAEYMAETLHAAWGAGVLTNARDKVSDLEVLAHEMLAYDWYFPRIQDIEGRSLRSREDDPLSSLDDHFGEMRLPILYFGASNWGADGLIAGIHSAGHAGSKDVTIHVLENYGHLDVLFARDAPQTVYQVMLSWIRQRAVRSP